MVQWLRKQALGMDVLGSNSGDDQPMYTRIFKLFLYSVYPVPVTKVSSFFT